jgi:DNA polymerase-3 subunit gamma/tau
MSHQVLARKYRPRLFPQVVGQAHVVTALQNALAAGRLHHAYLFTGTRGVGKTTLARILAKSLNCVGADGQGGLTPDPCGVCSACREIDQGRFVDLLEVDAATNTGVDAMRDLLDTAQYMPVAGRFKVYIIDEVHMLSKSAFNSMLKTLEEPPEHLKFILATTDPQRVPVTVLSRCLQFNLKNLAPPTLAAHLADVLARENIPFETAALELLGHAAEGSARDSLSLLDQAIAFGAGTVNADQVAQMLGATSADVLHPLALHLAAGDGPALLNAIDLLAERNLSFDALLTDWAALMHRVAVLQALGAGGEKLAESAVATRLAVELAPEDVQVFYQVALLSRRDLSLAPDERTGFAMAMLRMLSFRPEKVGAGGTQGARSTGAASNTGSAVRSAVAGVSAQGADSVAPLTIASLPHRTLSSAPTAAPTQSPDTPSKSRATGAPAFDGDWAALVDRAAFSGMANLAARNAVLASAQNNHFVLSVPADAKQYAQPAYEDALRRDLERVLGRAVRVSLSVGEASAPTVAQAADAALARDLADAKKALLADPFVQALVNEFGAQFDESSIRPPARGGATLH